MTEKPNLFMKTAALFLVFSLAQSNGSAMDLNAMLGRHGGMPLHPGLFRIEALASRPICMTYGGMFEHQRILTIEAEAADHPWPHPECLPRTAPSAPKTPPAVASTRKPTPAQMLVDLMRTFRWLNRKSNSWEKSPNERLRIRSPQATERLQHVRKAAWQLLLHFESTSKKKILAMTLEDDLRDEMRHALQGLQAVFWTEIAERFLETPLGRQLRPTPLGPLGMVDFPKKDLVSATASIFRFLLRGVIPETRWDNSKGLPWPKAGIIDEIVNALSDANLHEKLVSHLKGSQRASAGHRVWRRVSQGSDLPDRLRHDLESLGFTVLAGDTDSLMKELLHLHLPVSEQGAFASVPDQVLRSVLKFLSHHGADHMVLLLRFDPDQDRLQVSAIANGPGIMKEGKHWPIEEAVETDEHLSMVHQRASRLLILTHHQEAGGASTGYLWSDTMPREIPVPTSHIKHGTLLEIELEPDTKGEEEGSTFSIGSLKITFIGLNTSAHDALKTALGTIAGEDLKAQDKKSIRERIRGGSMEVLELNRTALWAVEVACANILSHQSQRLEELLKETGDFNSLAIAKALEILANPLAHFQYFFYAKKFFNRNQPGWYYLGDSESLAVDLIYFLMRQEQEGSGHHLLEEYVLHEILESLRPSGKTLAQWHMSVIKLTQRLFERAEKPSGPGWRGRTVLGSLLRKFISLHVQGRVQPEVEPELQPLMPLWNFLHWLVDIPPEFLRLDLDDKWQLLLGLTPRRLSARDQRTFIERLLRHDQDLALSIDLLIAQFKPDPDLSAERRQAAAVARKYNVLQERIDVWLDAAQLRAAAYAHVDHLRYFLENARVFIGYLMQERRSQEPEPRGGRRRNSSA